jgi:hypothetical protein
MGAGAAMACAIAATRFEWVMLLDSDGQFPIAALAPMAAALEDPPVRAVIGARRRKQDSAFARFGSVASGWVCNRLYGSRYRDFNSVCKLVDGALLRRLPLEARGLNHSTDVSGKLLEAGIPMTEVLVEHLARDAGGSHRTAVRSTADRLLFVAYLATRKALLWQRVLMGGLPPGTGDERG